MKYKYEERADTARKYPIQTKTTRTRIKVRLIKLEARMKQVQANRAITLIRETYRTKQRNKV